MKRLSFVLILLGTFLIFSCKKNKDDKEPPREYPFYFTGSINGVDLKYQANDSDATYSCEISQRQNSNGVDYDIYEGTVIMDKATIPSNAVYVHVLKHFNHNPSAAERLAMIHTGDYGYGIANLNSTVDGASISYVDADGNLWTSETGVQTGSTFNISEIVDNTADNSAKIFKATFTCKVYNGATSRQISNATIRGKILSP